MTGPVEYARRLVSLDTAGNGEAVAAELLAGILERAGADVTIDTVSEGRASLVARTRAVSESPLVLSGHLDTVTHATHGWSCEPLAGDVVDGFLIGCGASDMKGGIGALVWAFEQHLSSGPLVNDVCLVLTAAEETGCLGAHHLVEAGLVPAGGPLLVAEPTNNQLAPGHKGALWVQLTATGLAAHGSRPDLGRSAIIPLARLATRLAAQGFDCGRRALTDITVNVGTFSGGSQVNLVPDSATMTLDIRPVPGTESPEILASLGELAGNDVVMHVLLDLPAVNAVEDSVFAELVARSAADVFGTASYREPLSYFTDASVLAPAMETSEIVLFGPGDPAQAHTPDERCSTAAIEQAAQVYASVLKCWEQSSSRSTRSTCSAWIPATRRVARKAPSPPDG